MSRQQSPGRSIRDLPPRELAKRLIWQFVRRGDTIHEIVMGSPGMSGPREPGVRPGVPWYGASVHGHCVEVDRANGVSYDPPRRFPLAQIVREIRSDLAHESLATQPSLWAASVWDAANSQEANT